MVSWNFELKMQNYT